MNLLIQRVTDARVRIAGETIGQIGRGFLVLIGIRLSDDETAARSLAARTAALRIFPDDAGRMNRSLRDIAGEVLAISQFTLVADTRKGNRPGFADAAPPEQAEPLYELYVKSLRETLGADRVRTGRFGADMQVELINDGPVTIALEQETGTAPRKIIRPGPA
ncbi:MAG: D-aminoacyl-tRNA deacylase [Kiritimatiellia bacterium]|nr:D-aminoacyl-tRNA deacylase [Kiritimatiellia bacterium]